MTGVKVSSTIPRHFHLIIIIQIFPFLKSGHGTFGNVHDLMHRPVHYSIG